MKKYQSTARLTMCNGVVRNVIYLRAEFVAEKGSSAISDYHKEINAARLVGAMITRHAWIISTLVRVCTKNVHTLLDYTTDECATRNHARTVCDVQKVL